MNATIFNDTEIDSLVPFVEEVDNDEEPVYVGFIESSLMKIVPKFFKAIVTLLISGMLLGGTFLLITLWKRGCRTHRKLVEDGRGKNGHAGAPLHSVIVTPPEDDDASLDDSTIPSTSLQPVKSKHASNMKVPKQALLRRASGPFGSEALSFVGEQYTMKTIEKERHHHVEGHGHGHHGHHHPHFHSGASSTGGSSIHQNVEENREPKSKWNCFKSNN